jgi:signal transduction histidine kinase/CheY-like chemotaxis protein
MGATIRIHDWQATSLGEPAVWPAALKTLIGVMLGASQPMFVAWGPERLLLYNDGYAPMLGDRHPDAIGKPFFVVWPEVVDECFPLFEQVFSGHPVNMDDIELRLDRPARPREAHFSFSYCPVRDEEGAVEGLFCVCNETTEVALARWREAQVAFQRSLIETLRPLSDPVVVQSEASRLLGEYLGANRVVYFEIRGEEYVIERDFVLGVQPLAGRYPVASFGTELLATLRAGRTVVEPDATEQTYRSASENASFASIQVRGHIDVPLVKDGRFVAGMTVHCSDRREWSEQEVALVEDTAERTWAAIERVRAEAALQVSEERSAFVRRSSGIGFWYCDLPFDVLQWDELVKHHFHLPSGAHVTIQTFYDRIHPDDREPTRLAIERSTQDKTHYNTQYRTVNPETGAIRWVRAIGRTSYREDGTPISFDGVTIDVSDQKLAEASLREADRRKDEFLATLAHELRNPLAPLRNGLQILRIGAGDQAVVGRARDMMERQVDIMVRLVDDLLDVARVSGGKIELRKQRESLQTVVARAVETAMPAIEAHRHTLMVEAPADPIPVDVDSARLTQVLANLLGNAAKYTPSGGRLTVAASIENREAVASVADNGVGLPPDALSRVFDMFAQVGETRSMAQGGLGIGLFLAKKLVDLHGGRLSAYSEGAGRGSTFTVRLPLANLALEPVLETLPESQQTAVPVSLRILVVDDNLDAGDSLALRLSLQGHQTRVARDGISGLRAAREFQPHVAFVDIGMPSMNGYEFAEASRNADFRSSMVLVALTGWGSEADVHRATAAGFDLHLTKPASLEDIESILQGVGI